MFNALRRWIGALGARDRTLQEIQTAVLLRRHAWTQKQNVKTSLRLVEALDELDIRLRADRRIEDELMVAREAAQLWRGLVIHNRSRHLPKLARSLNNLGISLRWAGLLSESVTVAEESVRLFRELTEFRREQFLPGLAGSVSNLGNSLDAFDRHPEAVAAAREAVAIAHEVVACRGSAFHLALARYQHNLESMLAIAEPEPQRRQGDLGHAYKADPSAEGLSPFASVNASAQLTSNLRAGPGAKAALRGVADSLAHVGARLSQEGRLNEALAAFKESVALFRQLVLEDRKTYLVGPAESVTRCSETTFG